MNPFFFGSGKHRLFGIYSAASGVSAGDDARAAVLCNPWGAEYQYAHRSMRYLADALNAAGVHVLRFDYFGTGDSGGEAHEMGLADWVFDVETAIEELQDSTGVQRVDLVGLRLGAMLAVQAGINKQQQVGRLVLWDPVLGGEDYLRELRESLPGLQRARRPEEEIQGFPLTHKLSNELLGVNLHVALPAFAGSTLVLVSRTNTVDAKLQALQNSGHSDSVTVEAIESLPVWHPERGVGVGAVPAELVRRIAGWLGR